MTRRAWRSLFPAWTTGVMGFFLVAAITALPEVIPALVSQDGMVWSPLNAPRLHIGDSSYYAAFTAEVLEGRVPANNPSGHDRHGEQWIELFKTTSHVLSAAPGLFLRDFRLVYLTSLSVFPGVLFLLAFLLARHFSVGQGLSALIGLWYVYYFNAVYTFLAVDPLSVAVSQALCEFKRLLTIGGGEYDLLNDNFRFLITSVSGCVQLAFFLVVVRCMQVPSIPRMVLGVSFGLGLSLAYLPAAIVGFAFLLVLFAVACLERRWSMAQTLGIVGFCILLTLLATGYPSRLQSAQSNTAMWKLYFARELTIDQGVRLLLSRIALRWAVVSGVCIVLSWRDAHLRLCLSSISLVGAAVFMGTIAKGDDQLFGKLFSRAYLHPWVILCAIAICRASQSGLMKLAASCEFARRAMTTSFKIAGVGFLVGVPIYGFTTFGSTNASGVSRFLPRGQWEAYAWLRENTPPDSVVLALDWDDMHLVPIFTRNDLAAGHMQTLNIAPFQAIERYAAAWRFLGRSRSDFEALVRGSVRAYRVDWRLPVDKVICERGSFVADLVYWPYIPVVDNIPVADSTMMATSSAFVARVLDIYDRSDWKRTIRNSACQFVLLSDFHFDRVRPLEPPAGFTLRYGNRDRRIFEVHLDRALQAVQ